MGKKIGDNSIFAVVSSKGATIHEFVCHGHQIIFPLTLVGDKVRGGIPICFPFFGPPPEGWNIPKHGWLRNEELKVIESSAMHIMFMGENEPMESYPWRLNYKITITIIPEIGLELKLLITRLNDGQYFSAPINPAFHPYFNSDYRNRMLAPCMAKVDTQVITSFEKDARLIHVGEQILIRAGIETVEMKLGGDFNRRSYLALWSDSLNAPKDFVEQSYFCVEPVLIHPNDFRDIDGGKFLKEGEQSEITCRFMIR